MYLLNANDTVVLSCIGLFHRSIVSRYHVLLTVNPHTFDADKRDMIAGIVVGSIIGTLAFSACIVYVVKWRKMRTSCK